ncbi:MAG TPA: bifunctional glutamate--cysteine ligase GshA/glutathione synthetase GshB [Opitutales bacterium]|nr:bifunctional glutamate--cysteine ligase GshA/glutathione synthetase GshB [Opitutales bacterium]
MDEIVDAIRRSPRLQNLLWKGKFGLEIERLRVDSEGKLALTPHPPGLGNKSEHPYITTDFSESQLEMISPPLDSVDEAYGFVKTLHNVVQGELAPGELLWPQSMPPILPPEEEIPLARFDGDASGRTAYRRYLSGVYGRARQTISGGHFNISFLPEFFEVLANAVEIPIGELKEKVYLKIVRNLMRHRWFLVGLLGRSPIAHESLRLKSLGSEEWMEVCCEFGTSIRFSQIGYRNRESLWVDYSSIQAYKERVQQYVAEGKLLNPNELYLPVRIKELPDSDEISHIEIRTFDLDPFDPIGVTPAGLRIAHIFLIYSLFLDEEGVFGREEQKRGEELQNEVACLAFAESDCRGEKRRLSFSFREETLAIFDRIQNELRLDDSSTPSGYLDAWTAFRGFIEDPETHPANEIKRSVAADGFIKFHLNRAHEQIAELSADAYKFYGFSDLELSTQLLLKAAVRRGIHFDFLDRRANFVRLRKGAKEELVMQATKTSLDRYSNILAMENKVVTKRLLEEQEILVPAGADFSDLAEAKLTWNEYRNRPVVVKPVNTNFGIGVSVLTENRDRADFERAIEMAFVEDDQILIEEYIPGKEYRFFLIENQVVAILHRVPANVTGDGRKTIRELVEEKNRDPLRGKGYVTPLEKIGLGEPEAMHLRNQKLDFDSIPEEGKTVFLRENSNISTGGDSIDYTDRAHPSYSEIASAASRALGVKITGLDMIVKDISAPAAPGEYAVIELNFNPAIHIHCHPYHGENRRLDEHILSALGFL